MLFDKASAEWDKKENNQGSCNIQKPFSYADIVASPCDTSTIANVDDIENNPPPPQQIIVSFFFLIFYLSFFQLHSNLYLLYECFLYVSLIPSLNSLFLSLTEINKDFYRTLTINDQEH